MLSCLSFQNSS